MSYLTYTLVGDGPSDRALLHPINWVLRSTTERQFLPSFASYSELRSTDLAQKVTRALRLFPCDILFVHRDAERVDAFESRRDEIHAALPASCLCVPIIPVRMTEAWFLFDEHAIRRAANNPNGIQRLRLPSLRMTEAMPDPKATMFDQLRVASGLNARRLRTFNEGRARARVAELIDDFSPLRALRAFVEFEREVQAAIERVV